MWQILRSQIQDVNISVLFTRNTDSDLKYMKSYQPETDEVQHHRILLHGPVGAGKSSFINSVSNVLQDRMTTAALVNASNADKSFTKEVKKYLSVRNVKDYTASCSNQKQSPRSRSDSITSTQARTLSAWWSIPGAWFVHLSSSSAITWFKYDSGFPGGYLLANSRSTDPQV